MKEFFEDGTPKTTSELDKAGNGLIREFFKGGKLRKEIRTENGIKWIKDYYESGKLAAEENWSGGEPVRKYYNEDGTEMSEKNVNPKMAYGINIAYEACKHSRDGVLGAVRSGIMAFKAKKFPAKLDSAKDGACGDDNHFFTKVLQEGDITDSTWSKKGLTYTHNCKGDQQSFTYNPQNGEFK